MGFEESGRGKMIKDYWTEDEMEEDLNIVKK
jgi:hypothetical protein